MNLSFAGCGFLGIYHVGVAVCFRKYAPHLLLDKISGASAGAIAACCLLCDLPLGEMTSDVLRVVGEARSRSLGPLSPSFNIQTVLFEGLMKFLPEDAHLRVNGKLHVSLTRVYDGKNVIVSQFTSREDLLQALLASCFIPVVSGILPPRFHGIRYMDGGFSDNLPTLDENTVTVSPFCGESDICPRDISSQLFHLNIANTSIEISKQNINRFARILFPPKPEVLSNMCKQGFDDALRFLSKNNLLNCTRCLAVQTTYVVSDSLDDADEYDPQCLECKNHRQEALVANLPDTVMTVFQNAIETANKGLINWVFKHRGMKLLSVLSLPYTLPADIVYATLTKLLLTTNNFVSLVGDTVETRMWEYKVLGNAAIRQSIIQQACANHITQSNRLMASAPFLSDQISNITKYILDQLAHLVHKVNYKSQLSTNISCQLAIAEYGAQYGGAQYDIEAMKDMPVPAKNQLINFNFYPNEGVSASELQQAHSRPRTPHSLNMEDDTFEHILQVTAHHEAVMAYYYMDENNKVKVTEIFDVTDADTPALHSPAEHEANTLLQFDDDEFDSSSFFGSAPDPILQALEFDGKDHRYSDLAQDFEETSSIFSDPESEWASAIHPQIEEPDDFDDNTTFRPESEQPSLMGSVARRAMERSYNINIMDM